MTRKEINILLVEDNPGDIRLVREALGECGMNHRLEVVVDGVAALEYLRRGKSSLNGSLPDLIILDVMLPGMDGFEICYRLRSDPATANLPILMFSAKAQEIDKNTGIRVGADEYLTKPSAPTDIVKRVEKLLAKKSSGPKSQAKVIQ